MSGIYVHIPFCRQACLYCNFYFQTGRKDQRPLFEALKKEADLHRDEWGKIPETLYFGGGTPSYSEPVLIEGLMQHILGGMSPDSLKEITLEANPDDMSREKLKAWKNMGITRLSVGVQTFHDAGLKWMNRTHNSKEAMEALGMAAEEGFELSIDLIFGVPGSTGEEWMNNLETAMKFEPVHLSCYGLTMEENTPWQRLAAKGRMAGPDDEISVRQFGMTMDFMQEQGWWHYEISNYCKPGKTAVHNTSYWQGKAYTGLGPAAHSYDGQVRRWNVADLQKYTESVMQGSPETGSETIGMAEKHNEYVMTSLRTMWGCDPPVLQSFGHFTATHQNKINQFLDAGLLVETEGKWVLTREGKFMADRMASELFV